ncbi:hypothetical protein GFY24_03765 [Nocardia sp. SYP-A9097]|uniref:hypothetical protein n=1 Tax=Nocardia sp. SYP-A9097 TaxID=2663237 RepID=UPI00129A1AEB|nr:hypothetical protein [Nocardia sp. SYP-A9097]MRH86595.1 hypothetical protein [Nocardia sp. SYP-A9097]
MPTSSNVPTSQDIQPLYERTADALGVDHPAAKALKAAAEELSVVAAQGQRRYGDVE